MNGVGIKVIKREFKHKKNKYIIKEVQYNIGVCVIKYNNVVIIYTNCYSTSLIHKIMKGLKKGIYLNNKFGYNLSRTIIEVRR